MDHKSVNDEDMFYVVESAGHAADEGFCDIHSRCWAIQVQQEQRIDE